MAQNLRDKYEHEDKKEINIVTPVSSALLQKNSVFSKLFALAMYASSCEKLRFFHLPELGWKFFCCSDQQDAGSQLVRRRAFILISDLLKGSNSPSMTLSVVVAAVDIAHKLVGSVCCLSISS